MQLFSPRSAAVLALGATLALAPTAPAFAQLPPKAAAPGGAAKGGAAPAPAGKGAAAPPADDYAKIVDDARKAAKANKWEDARALFAKAYELKPGWRLAGELGRAELGVAKYRDAAEHLAIAYREKTDNLPEEEKKGIEEALAQALAQVGVLRINVRPKGAEIVVAGKAVGTAPLSGPIFVDPGPVLVEARLEGYFGLRTTKTLAAGTEETVDLSLHRAGRAGDVPPPSATSTEGIFSGVNLPIAISGAAVAAAATLAGGAFAIVSAVKAGASHSLEEPDRTCGATCKDQFDALQKQKVTFAGASMWSFIGAGAVLLGTGAYVTVTLITRPKQPLKASFVVRPDHVGAVLSTQW
ncbi:Dihydrolipoamide acetyltransferase [Minicystis rosea]|nr:Dihydrolipoamide acetyltransferase [Minicystis rosea]